MMKNISLIFLNKKLRTYGAHGWFIAGLLPKLGPEGARKFDVQEHSLHRSDIMVAGLMYRSIRSIGAILWRV